MPRLHVVPSVPSACAEAASVAEPKTAYKGEVALHQQAQGLQTRSMWNAPPKNQTVLAFKARRKQQTLGHGAAAKHFPARVLAARPVSRSSGRGLCGPPLSGDAARAIPPTREKRYYQSLDSCGLGLWCWPSRLLSFSGALTRLTELIRLHLGEPGRSAENLCPPFPPIQS